MKQFALIFGLLLFGALSLLVATSLSSDALGFAAGIVFGVLAGIPVALLVLASSARNQRPYDVDDYKADYHTLERFDQRQPFPYQPPVIVLATPVADKPQAPNTVPTVYDRQRDVAAQHGRKEVQRVGLNGQGVRVFRVVGEREEWDE